MDKTRKYECPHCGRHVFVDASDQAVPDCCGALMVRADRLPACGVSTTAEHTRAFDDGEPCDDGRGGNL